MSVRVRKAGWDWLAWCPAHADFDLIADAWSDAYEAALGHVCMHHPAPTCVHEYGYVIGSTNEHRCVTCGAHLPPVFWHEWPQETPC